MVAIAKTAVKLPLGSRRYRVPSGLDHRHPHMQRAKKPTSQKVFQQLRRDHAMETAEDYVEAVASILAEQGTCRGMDLARHFDVSHVTVSKILARLKVEGLVRARPYGPVELTEAGARLADASQQRHQIVLRFLMAIGVDEKTAHIDAEGIEHHVSQRTLARFRDFLDRNEGTA